VVDRADGWSDETWAAGAADAVEAEVSALVGAVTTSPRDLVLVTNEVGQGVVPATASGRRFRDLMGVLNLRVGDACGDVLWCVAGRTVRL
jgi:adenosylcobinamide kinase/adenosylcobinamide-phosphate guanylyltransferase